MPEPITAWPMSAYARGCLAAARADRDWIRDAVARLEAAGARIVQTDQPGKDGEPWTVRDWRTGEVLATITGGQDDYEAAWRDGWTDVCWIGAWLDDLAGDGRPAPDWPDALPPPPAVPGTVPALALPLPASLARRLEDAIEAWADAAGLIRGRADEVAELTGWSIDEVLACTGSFLTITGERYMRLGDAGPARHDRRPLRS